MALPFDVSVSQGLYLAAALVLAAFVRGYSGFGFSAIFIACAALVANPLPLVPVVFACEIAMTAFQARGIRADIDWPKVGALIVGAGLAVWPAVAVMARLGEEAARLAVSALILGLGLILLGGWRSRRVFGAPGYVSAGVAAGLANSAGVGGLPVAAFLSAQPIPPAVFRATMVVFLTGIDVMTLTVMALHGLIGPGTAAGAVLAFPFLALGIAIGTRAWLGASPEAFRRWAVLLLIALAALNIARVVV